MMNKYCCLINKLVGSCRLLLWCCTLLWLSSLGTNADGDGPGTAILLSGCQGTNLSEVNAYHDNLSKFLALAPRDSVKQDFKKYSFGSHPSDTFYGLFMCQGGVRPDDCSDCVTTASEDFMNHCSQMAGFGWYKICLLRYSNESFFDVRCKDEPLKVRNPTNVSSVDPYQFNQFLSKTFDDVVDRAANDTRPEKKFAVRTANYSSNQSDIIYTLAQCTPDLSNLNCSDCLRIAVAQRSSYCNYSRGCRLVLPSCMIRYELYSFYNALPSDEGISVPAPPPTPFDTAYPPGGKGKSGPTAQPAPLDTAPPPSGKGKKRLSKQAAIGIAVLTTFSGLLFVVLLVLLRRRSRKRRDDEIQEAYDEDESLQIDPESLQYSLSAIRIATNDFSVDNKIGQGGFGPVYKGTLPDGQDIAVKRLSTTSGQGAQEFKNEIAVVAKLQHRNLVRLLGFCLKGGEKLLIYEFVPNKSLDYFLFDPEKQRLLDWAGRYRIIAGIAKGLLYLHEDSRLRIVHRDFKTANILLDERMNPKIADFGMAKICGVDEFEGNTNRIAGTFGYMAPEYTMAGQFSVKSDVFSFGVVILEIIAGKKNSSFHKLEDSPDLLSYAWEQWENGTPLALLDPTIRDSCDENDVLKCIQIGLLCVEEDADRRPMMASVVYMLSGDSVTLPTPQFPVVSRLKKTGSIADELESDRSDTKLLFGSTSGSSSSVL